jgi:hypothetical protein
MLIQEAATYRTVHVNTNTDYHSSDPKSSKDALKVVTRAKISDSTSGPENH